MICTFIISYILYIDLPPPSFLQGFTDCLTSLRMLPPNGMNAEQQTFLSSLKIVPIVVQDAQSFQFPRSGGQPPPNFSYVYDSKDSLTTLPETNG